MRSLLTLIVIGLLSACAGPRYTVDDGRKVNEVLLANIRTYGAGERALRPAIARAAELKDAECDTQWELPFAVESSAEWSADDRVAWVRALGVDERLTVVARSADSQVQIGDRIAEVGGYGSEDTKKMMLELADLRDAGRAFNLKLFSGKVVTIKPFKLCRGYARLAPPASPLAQDYHWLLNVHPLQVAHGDLNDDEALWLVLWGQGVSEEGGARMKTYAYGTKIAGTLFNLFTIASGIQGAAAAANAAVKTAQSAAASVATEVLKQQLIDQATAAATNRLRDEATGLVKKLSQAQVMNAMQQAAANRGSLSGVAWIASTIFDDADAWAFARMGKLQANPLAAFSLHQKLIEKGLAANAMVLDPERMAALSKIAEARGLRDEMVAILQGIKPEELQFDMLDMPVASAPNSFSYEDANDPAARAQPFARGLVDGMLNMPVEANNGK
ncbi:MAG: hypothetical protein H7Y28_10205 [Rhodoferax sp.]|nr:hypothetical protein [Rhodoferax sp.]